MIGLRELLIVVDEGTATADCYRMAALVMVMTAARNNVQMHCDTTPPLLNNGSTA